MQQQHSTGCVPSRRIKKSIFCSDAAAVRVLLLVLLMSASTCSTEARRLRQYSLNNMLSAMNGMQIDVGHLLFGGPGIPATPSPQRHYKVNCDNPRPTIVLVPGGQQQQQEQNSRHRTGTIMSAKGTLVDNAEETGLLKNPVYCAVWDTPALLLHFPSAYRCSLLICMLNSTHVLAGISGSQLDGTQTGTDGCPQFSEPRQVWAEATWMKNLDCFAHMLSVNYNATTKR